MQHNIKVGDTIRTIYDNKCVVSKVNAKSITAVTPSGYKHNSALSIVRTLNASRFG